MGPSSEQGGEGWGKGSHRIGARSVGFMAHSSFRLLPWVMCRCSCECLGQEGVCMMLMQ